MFKYLEKHSNDSMAIFKSIENWFVFTRPWSFPMTLISVSIGSAAAAYKGSFDLSLYLLVLAGSVLAHAGVNVINDYYDTKYGVDRRGAPTTIYRPHPLVGGFTSSKALGAFGVILVALALTIGIYLAMVRGLLVLLLAALGLFLIVEYTGPPLKLKYRAAGELSVFIAWGVLMSLGGFYVLTGYLSVEPIAASTPFGLLVVAVLLANNIRDIEYDRSAGVRTIAVVMGREGSLMLYEALIVGAYLMTILFSLAGLTPWTTALVLLSAPSAIRLIKRFRAEVPPAADPMTASLAIKFGALVLIAYLISCTLKI